MIKKRSLTIVIVLGFLVSIIFSAMLSFADEKLVFTAYYPSPNAYYNRLNATDLSVTNHAYVGNSLAVGQETPGLDADISVVRTGETASLVMYGQGDATNSNHAELVLASPGTVNITDPNVWALTHNADNELAYVHHSSGDGSVWQQFLTLDTNGYMGLNTADPQSPLHIATSMERDLMRLESNSALGTGMMFRNTNADMGTDQYFGLGWGGSDANDRSDKLNFWYAGSDTSYDDPPIMTFYKNEHVGIRNQNPAYALDVGGGAIFDTDATDEPFIVRDRSKGNGSVIFYEFDTGKLFLGNQGASGSDPEVTIRNDMLVDRDLTVSSNLNVNGNLIVQGTLWITGSLCINGNCISDIPLWEPQVQAAGQAVQIKAYDARNAGYSSGWHTIYECGLDNCGLRAGGSDSWYWLNDD